MPNYRRAHVPGGTFFFTVVTHRRRKLFDSESNQKFLGDVIRECQRDWPFEMNAIVLLPDHLHAIWTLPPGDANFSGRWSVIKKNFTLRLLANGGADAPVSEGKRRGNSGAAYGSGGFGSTRSKAKMTSKLISTTSTTTL